MVSKWTGLHSHEEQRQLFQRSIARGRLSHAYVLSGPDGIGKRQFARLLARSLFCREHSEDELECCGECRACRSFETNTWPDYLEIGVLPGKSEILISQLIGSDASRGREGLCYELSMAPQASERRIAVINDAHRMNEDSANALLKTLEEPPVNALILLICDQPESLLPTIRSRCQVVRFFPLSDQEVSQILVQEEMVESPEAAKAVAELAEGSLTVAAQLLSSDLRSLKEQVIDELNHLERMNPVSIAKRVADEIERISSGGEEQRRNAMWLLRFVSEFLRRRMRKLADGDLDDPLLKRFGVRHGIDCLTPLQDRLHSAARQIEGNSPVRLILEALFDDIARQFRLGPVTAR
ncbi:MAG: DNA polymerase III subunit delta' [Planctomycetaceae bacterium]|nr:DNA polymerase III subunit delta' [Planctomycetaceae bacterium]